MKKCTRCQQEKPDTEFYRDSGRRCKECHRKDVGRKRRAYLDRNRQVVAVHLSRHPCADCGESDPVVLEFDHVRGTKVASVARLMLGGKQARLETEMAKCEVVCANCHRRRTANRAGWWKATR